MPTCPGEWVKLVFETGANPPAAFLLASAAHVTGLASTMYHTRLTLHTTLKDNTSLHLVLKNKIFRCFSNGVTPDPCIRSHVQIHTSSIQNSFLLLSIISTHCSSYYFGPCIYIYGPNILHCLNLLCYFSFFYSRQPLIAQVIDQLEVIHLGPKVGKSKHG